MTVQRGDVWSFGRHRLMCGDSTNNIDIARLLDGHTPRYGLHDPPYGLGAYGIGLLKKDGSTRGIKDRGSKKYHTVNWDDKPFDPAVVLKLCPDSIIWGANYYADKLPVSRGWIAWDKSGGNPDLTKDHNSDVEFAWTPFRVKARVYHHAWKGFVRAGHHGAFIHPTQKPIEVMEKIILQYFKEPGIILDLYAGSGPVLMACEHLGRACYSMEMDPFYCEKIIERWEKETGQLARFVSAGGRS